MSGTSSSVLAKIINLIINCKFYPLCGAWKIVVCGGIFTRLWKLLWVTEGDAHALKLQQGSCRPCYTFQKQKHLTSLSLWKRFGYFKACKRFQFFVDTLFERCIITKKKSECRQEAFSWIFERLIFSRKLTFFMKHCKKMGKSNCQNSSLKPWRGTINENVRKHFQKMKRRISLEKTSKLDLVQNPSFFFLIYRYSKF